MSSIDSSLFISPKQPAQVDVLAFNIVILGPFMQLTMKLRLMPLDGA
ncbi:MAG: hypothetical protein O7B35_07535 [Deltaproteobacteria bacterium]|nr:hypothetical protein [Deltaproteobacteria bacterium]